MCTSQEKETILGLFCDLARPASCAKMIPGDTQGNWEGGRVQNEEEYFAILGLVSIESMCKGVRWWDEGESRVGMVLAGEILFSVWSAETAVLLPCSVCVALHAAMQGQVWRYVRSKGGRRIQERKLHCLIRGRGGEGDGEEGRVSGNLGQLGREVKGVKVIVSSHSRLQSLRNPDRGIQGGSRLADE